MKKKKMKNELKNIALITGRIGSAFNATVIRGVEEITAAGRGIKYNFTYHSARENTKDAVSEEIISVLKDDNYDAVIVMGKKPLSSALRALRQNNMPVVFIERKVPGFHSVCIDNFNCGRSAAEYFIRLKKHNPAVILDPQSKDRGSSTNERYAGFAERMAAEGRKIPGIVTTHVKVHTLDNGRQAFDLIEKKMRKVDCVFSVAGDYAAIGFMLEAMAHGYRVPSDFALLGFDDVEMSSAVSPGLSTIRQPITRMGAEAIKILDNHFKNKRHGIEQRVLKSSFVSRKTT